MLASLNHPHIGAIYGFEDSGDTHALVLELVEGDTLADRIARGPLPFDEALPIARQIAEALEAAHEHGIIHRDLKPANIKVTPDGVVKVLDFGLAKLTGPAESGPHGRPDLSQSPTITSPAMMTGVGTLLGTAAYMSPEQAKGRPADKRSDVWAFGCVLYEMLTGARAFDGEDTTDVLGAVVRLEPKWDAIPSGVPPRSRDAAARVPDEGSPGSRGRHFNRAVRAGAGHEPRRASRRGTSSAIAAHAAVAARRCAHRRRAHRRRGGRRGDVVCHAPGCSNTAPCLQADDQFAP